ncbi:homogentisate 1,2-dioxygenase [Novosphingobium album (ex Liu et al. 2023)]|uniref:Homogentisate 1,2-dioxygenase n=1 Tax=Novosphingobium album (ex Liu et al. 2023) TaxID=3031130 RepID=A0ABT5WS80_9SPHN|nr:homogentisate 1,2-dioxygenase [Novosphingobium album (ex Liu et al. 2023)]MDE8652906.1 homogentisate 1,2-dioxygenase [Novosphingobium album (ex Liu et al. 2023)]
MIRFRAAIVLASAAWLGGGPVAAMAAEPAMTPEPDGAACTAPAPPPAPMEGWAGRHVALTAATRPDAAGKALLTLGQAADATLAQTPRVRYAVEPAKPGGSVSYGGLFAFDVPEAGTYRVAQDGRSWVDVIEGGKALGSVAHGHGPACSGIAKMVDYTLQPGRHIVQIAAQGEPALTIMVTRLP